MQHGLNEGLHMICVQKQMQNAVVMAACSQRSIAEMQRWLQVCELPRRGKLEVQYSKGTCQHNAWMRLIVLVLTQCDLWFARTRGDGTF